MKIQKTQNMFNRMLKKEDIKIYKCKDVEKVFKDGIVCAHKISAYDENKNIVATLVRKKGGIKEFTYVKSLVCPFTQYCSISLTRITKKILHYNKTQEIIFKFNNIDELTQIIPFKNNKKQKFADNELEPYKQLAKKLLKFVR